MRIATGVIALVLMVIVGLQACVVYGGAALVEDEGLTEGGAMGLLITLLYLVGGAFAFGKPMIALVAFALAGVLGVLVGATTVFADMTLWGFAAFFLAAMSYMGHREIKRKQRADSTLQ